MEHTLQKLTVTTTTDVEKALMLYMYSKHALQIEQQDSQSLEVTKEFAARSCSAAC